MKYSILMPYHNRAGQLHNTLTSFVHHYKDRDDFEVVIVEDAKNAQDKELHLSLVTVLAHFKQHICIKHVISQRQDCFNPAPMFNLATLWAVGEFFIITNPECFHMTNILAGLDEEFGKDEDSYVVCSCEAAKKNIEFVNDFHHFHYSHHMWYQHSVNRNKMLHFCTAISQQNYLSIGGFDDRFSKGIAYDDDDFRDAVLMDGRLIPILRDDLLVIHCNHDKAGSRLKNYKALVKRNKELYEVKRTVRERRLAHV